MLPSDVIYLGADRAAHSSVKLSAAKKHILVPYRTKPGHSETYKSLSEDSLICNSTQADQRFRFPYD